MPILVREIEQVSVLSMGPLFEEEEEEGACKYMANHLQNHRDVYHVCKGDWCIHITVLSTSSRTVYASTDGPNQGILGLFKLMQELLVSVAFPSRSREKDEMACAAARPSRFAIALPRPPRPPRPPTRRYDASERRCKSCLTAVTLRCCGFLGIVTTILPAYVLAFLHVLAKVRQCLLPREHFHGFGRPDQSLAVKAYALVK
ncbi:MAG: hypothetical protein Q9228_005599 [Teloschistes exilis]